MTGEETTTRERLELLKQLQHEGIILHMNIQGTYFKKLTVINQVGASENRWRFAVDCPPGYREAISGLRKKLFDFSFIGRDGIPRRFTTTGGKIIKDNQLLFDIPGVVEQRHRRQHFRIPAPSGAFATTRVNGVEERLNIIDVSQGGFLAVSSGEDKKEQKYTMGQELADIRLNLLTGAQNDPPVTIERAEIKRVAFDKNTENYYYGLMFIKITDDEQMRLKERIYVNQRQMLRKRRH